MDVGNKRHGVMATGSPTLRAPGRQGRRRRLPAGPPWRFALPAILVFGVFFLLPNVMNFVLPFTNWSGFHAGIRFTGLKTFKSLVIDGTLWTGLRVTITYAVVTAALTNLFGLGLALLLERDTRLNRLLRSLFFLPVLISALAVGYIFQALLAPDGALNAAIAAVLGHPVSIPWLGSTGWTLMVVCVVSSWKWMGLSMLIYLAGLKTMPQDILEAARIDGASRAATFRRIRWPLLAPALTFNVGTSLIGSLNAFDIVLATTDGGPASTTQVVPIYIFHVFGQGLYAQAAAMNLVLFLVALAMALPLVMFLRRREQAL